MDPELPEGDPDDLAGMLRETMREQHEAFKDGSDTDELKGDLSNAGAGEDPESRVATVEVDGKDAAPDAEPEADADPEDDPDDPTGIAAEIRARNLAAQLQPPEHWSNEDKTKFQALPSDQVRQTILDWRKQIEGGAQEKFEQAAEARKLHGEVSTLLKPYEQLMQRDGVTVTEAVKRLFAAENLLRQDPAQGLLTLAQQYGRSVAGTGQARELLQHMAHALGVGAGALAQPGNGQAVPNDPRQAEIDDLHARLSAFERQAAETQQATMTAAVTRAQSQVQEFTEAKDEAGQPKFPHFERVRGTMAQLWQASSAAGETLTLADAYDRAVYADPELRAEMIKAKQVEDAKRAAKASRDHAAKAGRARTPTSASVAGGDAPVDQSLADDIRQTYREQVGRSR